jgi:hypothetical protein
VIGRGSPQKFLGYELADDRLDEGARDFLHCLIRLWIAKEYDGYAIL